MSIAGAMSKFSWYLLKLQIQLTKLFLEIFFKTSNYKLQDNSTSIISFFPPTSFPHWVFIFFPIFSREGNCSRSKKLTLDDSQTIMGLELSPKLATAMRLTAS